MEFAAGKRCTSTSSDCRRRRMEIRKLKATRTGTSTGTSGCTVQGRKECSRNMEMQVTAASSASTVVNIQPRTSPCYVVASVIGKRRQMEDSLKVVPGLIETGSESGALDYYDFFAVYDGHGGAQVAHKCRDRMHMVIAEEVAWQWDKPELDQLVWWESKMVESFKKLDAELGAAPEKGSMGSTALVALVGKSRIVVANCGDSRAVLSRGGKPFALSSDHKPNRPDEMQRIEEAGGTVIDWNGYRVWGILATSRSIGDHQLKPWVSCKPEVTVTDRSSEDEFLILATDGLWDVVSEEMACQIVRNSLCGQSTCTPDAVSNAATLLTQIAMSQGTRDNISVIIVSSTLQ